MNCCGRATIEDQRVQHVTARSMVGFSRQRRSHHGAMNATDPVKRRRERNARAKCGNNMRVLPSSESR